MMIEIRSTVNNLLLTFNAGLVWDDYVEGGWVIEVSDLDMQLIWGAGASFGLVIELILLAYEHNFTGSITENGFVYSVVEPDYDLPPASASQPIPLAA